MVDVVNKLGSLMIISLIILIIYAIIYFLIFLCGKLLARKLLNNTLLKILYVLTSLPFLFCGLYVISIVFVFDYNPLIKILTIIFGIFLIIYFIRRAIIKINDIEYFGGV